MTWLRIDDSFAEHGKVLALPRADRWAWMELLCYCARQSSGKVPGSISDLLRYATPAFLSKCVSAGLLDKAEDGSLEVHDWSVYNPKDPTGAVRQSRHRNAKRNADRNGESNDESNASRVGARAFPTRPPSPIQEGKGRVRSEETGDAAPASPNGAVPLIDRIMTLVHRDWDQYPSKTDLRLELVDRGLSEAQAVNLIEAEQLARQPVPLVAEGEPT